MVKPGDVLTITLDRRILVYKVLDRGHAARPGRGSAHALRGPVAAAAAQGERCRRRDRCRCAMPAAAGRPRGSAARPTGCAARTERSATPLRRGGKLFPAAAAVRKQQPCKPPAKRLPHRETLQHAGQVPEPPMTYVVTDNCIKCKYMDCIEVCPVDCFYEGENMLVIHPDECIDCGVCEPECPAEAIKPDTEPGLDKWLRDQHRIRRPSGRTSPPRRSRRRTPRSSTASRASSRNTSRPEPGEGD